MPRFEPSAEPPVDNVAEPCAEKGLVVVTYVYPDETPEDHQEAVADLNRQDHDEKPVANRYEFLVDFSPIEWDDDEEEDEEQQEEQEEQEEQQQDDEVEERELIVNTSSQRWSPPHADDDYIAVVQANHTTYVTITLHACWRDRWLGVSEVFASHRVYARRRDAEHDYQDRLVQSLSAASQEVGGPAVTTVTADGFIRDDFHVIAAFHQCSLLEEVDEALHSRLLVHVEGFNREHVGAENVLPELPGHSAGGNVTISPPTPSHPYGAILVGIGKCWPSDLSSYAKAVLQPIIPVYAEGGDVQHTDEFVGFAGGPDNWKMVCASPNLALQLLERLKERRPSLPAEQILPGCLAGHQVATADRVKLTRENGRGKFLLEDRRRFLQKRGAACWANRTFLIKQLGIDGNRAVDVPVLKNVLMPNAANFLPSNGGAVVPRQHSFRITADDATAIFEGMFDDLSIAGLIAQSTHVELWADVADMTYRDLAGTHVDPENGEALDQRAAALALANNADVNAPIAAGSFVRIPCPADTVDLFDAHLYLLYRQLGIPMRFVHSAKLHHGGGNLHCATNYCPDFENLPFAQFPGVESVGDLREKLTDPAMVADLEAVETLKNELESAVQEAIGQLPDDEEDDDDSS